MVRWRYCLVLAMLLLLPTRTGQLEDDDDDDRRDEDSEDEDDDDDDSDDEQSAAEKAAHRRREPDMMRHVQPSTKSIAKLRPLECFVCAYKAETPLRACLDPTKFRVHTITCHSSEDRCFTSVVTRGGSYDAVLRGCRTSCVPTPDTTCCELNRCNSQPFAMPMQLAEAGVVSEASKTSKTIPPTVLFFVTILLVLQTVVKLNRCNSQAFAMPMQLAEAGVVSEASKTSKTIPPTVLFFVTILLVLQTVVKVTIV